MCPFHHLDECCLSQNNVMSQIVSFGLLCVRLDGKSKAMKVRSMVGLIPLYACLVLEDEVIQSLPGFKKRLMWFLENRKDLAKQVTYKCKNWFQSVQK